jgi:hypothetical protein
VVPLCSLYPRRCPYPKRFFLCRLHSAAKHRLIMVLTETYFLQSIAAKRATAPRPEWPYRFGRPPPAIRQKVRKPACPGEPNVAIPIVPLIQVAPSVRASAQSKPDIHKRTSMVTKCDSSPFGCDAIPWFHPLREIAYTAAPEQHCDWAMKSPETTSKDPLTTRVSAEPPMVHIWKLTLSQFS